MVRHRWSPRSNEGTHDASSEGEYRSDSGTSQESFAHRRSTAGRASDSSAKTGGRGPTSSWLDGGEAEEARSMLMAPARQERSGGLVTWGCYLSADVGAGQFVLHKA